MEVETAQGLYNFASWHCHRLARLSINEGVAHGKYECFDNFALTRIVRVYYDKSYMTHPEVVVVVFAGVDEMVEFALELRNMYEVTRMAEIETKGCGGCEKCEERDPAAPVECDGTPEEVFGDEDIISVSALREAISRTDFPTTVRPYSGLSYSTYRSFDDATDGAIDDPLQSVRGYTVLREDAHYMAQLRYLVDAREVCGTSHYYYGNWMPSEGEDDMACAFPLCEACCNVNIARRAAAAPAQVDEDPSFVLKSDSGTRLATTEPEEAPDTKRRKLDPSTTTTTEEGACETGAMIDLDL